MPTLEWIGKDKVVNHHQEVPFRVLERQYSYDEAGQHAEDNDSKNMIIHGDNLEALKALLPQYEGKVKCIYIDPPYNTGNEGWVYNDNVNDPKIKKWLGEVVGKEGEDLSRHDKWLCMMYPRLKLLQRLLAEEGAIFISIDDNELYNLKAICNEIFGAYNFVANVIWQKTYSPRNDALGIPYETDSILVYSKSKAWHPSKLKRTSKMDARHDNPDNDPIPWQSGDVSAAGAADHQGMVYAIQQPITGKLIYPAAGRHWKDEQATVLERMNKWAKYELKDIGDDDIRAKLCGVTTDNIRQGVMAIMLAQPLEEASMQAKERYNAGNWPEYYFTSNGTGGIRFKNHIKQNAGKSATNLWLFNDVGHTDEAKKELKSIFNGVAPIETPKPSRLIERIVQIASDPDSIILDSFAGSGTTAHAVLNMNKADGGNRKFILVEMEAYANNLTAERVKRVINGYKADQETVLYDEEITVKTLTQGAVMLETAKAVAKAAKGKYSSVKSPKIEEGHLRVVAVDKAKDMVDGLGGNFSYYELGPMLLLPDGNLNEEVGTQKIREYVYYMETKEPLTAEQPTDSPYFMGLCRNTAYYFYYERERVTTLDHAFLATVQTKAEGYTIYADLCAVPQETLNKYNITFKKIPRDIARL